MSYILDALRRADAERDRGNVPGIHAQPGYGAPMPAGAPVAPKPWAWLVAGALAVVVVGGAAWYVLAPAGRGAVEATPPVALAPVAPVAPVVTPQAAPVLPAALPAPVIAAPTAVVRRPKPTAPAPIAADAKPPATADKVYTQSELPEDIRRQLPTLTVGGSMYSSKPADRLLILNGQVAHEGDKVANDLVLQQIRLKSALMNFRGYRYTIDF